MAKIMKYLKKGSKIRVGDKLDMPKWGEFIVEGIYKVPGSKDYTVSCRSATSNRVYMVGEKQIIKFRRKWLKLVK